MTEKHESGDQSGRDNKVLLGKITGAHGLKGEVKIATFTAAPEYIAGYGPLSSSGSSMFEIISLRSANDNSVIARLKGVLDRTAAQQLRGVELYVSRDALPASEDDTFYHSDLMGLTGVNVQGDEIGEVIAVHNFGAGDLLEIRLSGTRQTELMPFNAETVPSIDLAAKRLVIDYDWNGDAVGDIDAVDDIIA